MCRSIVAESNVFNPTDKKTPIHLQCSSFAHILNEEQMGLCRQQSKVLSTSAIGVLQALNQCQKVFKDRPWNCSVFNSSTHYLGRFIDNCTYVSYYSTVNHYVCVMHNDINSYIYQQVHVHAYKAICYATSTIYRT